MTEHPPDTGSHIRWYEIRVRGRLGPRWSTQFDGMTVDTTVDGTTVLLGPVADQAALHGLLSRLGDLGITLLSVRQETDADTRPDNPCDSSTPTPWRD